MNDKNTIITSLFKLMLCKRHSHDSCVFPFGFDEREHKSEIRLNSSEDNQYYKEAVLSARPALPVVTQRGELLFF